MRKIFFACLAVLSAVQGLTSRQKTPGGQQACSEIGEVRHIPFHAEDKVGDAAYNQLREKSWSVVPCLIGQITNSSLTPDPRSAPIYPKVRVGDVAFWVVRDITRLPYDEMFPASVSRRFKKEGVYAYFDWVNRDGNRKKLQSKIQAWYMLHKPKEFS